ncbi:hypothetical protein FGO68_gene12347 [Halteria grandinella]|uniref:Uncharacterized protein n=1 Tax=Halteria grandinella TaxID=5974 RepID=A0A8J8NUU8_HALGN|nr:hypothetical protein FGO68_gene12347 [Halteria grandinella]
MRIQIWCWYWMSKPTAFSFVSLFNFFKYSLVQIFFDLSFFLPFIIFALQCTVSLILPMPSLIQTLFASYMAASQLLGDTLCFLEELKMAVLRVNLIEIYCWLSIQILNNLLKVFQKFIIKLTLRLYLNRLDILRLKEFHNNI